MNRYVYSLNDLVTVLLSQLYIQDGCPYFTSTGLNGGWQWILNATLNATTCTVAVTFVDFNDPFSSPLTNVSTCTGKCYHLASCMIVLTCVCVCVHMRACVHINMFISEIQPAVSV